MDARRERRSGLRGPTWIFDLDNTLHDAGPHIFPHLNRAMTVYLEVHLGLGRDEANALRMRYWRRYGATLPGLIRHHDVDPQHFLQETRLAGVVYVDDLLPETAYVKLLWALGQSTDPQRVRELMRRDQVGEFEDRHPLEPSS